MSKRHDISGGIDFTGGQLEMGRMIFYTILGWFSITIEAFLRYDFGERYYTKWNFIIGIWVLGYFSFCLLYTSPSPRDLSTSRMPSSA